MLGTSGRKAIERMLDQGVRCPFTSSVGRLFDAVAALVIGGRAPTFEGETAMALEHAADPACTETYPGPARAAAVKRSAR